MNPKDNPLVVISFVLVVAAMTVGATTVPNSEPLVDVTPTATPSDTATSSPTPIATPTPTPTPTPTATDCTLLCTSMRGYPMMIQVPSIASLQESSKNKSAKETPAKATPERDPTVARIGPLARVTRYRYDDGTLNMIIESKAPTLLTVAETPPPTGRTSGTISFQRVRLDKGKNRVSVPVQLHNGKAAVVLSTPGSLHEGRAAFVTIDRGSSLFPSGPWGEDDVRSAAIGGALAMAFAMLYEAVSAKIGAGISGERVA